MLYHIGKGLSWLAAKLIGRTQVIGRENIPRQGGVILSPNHSSYADPPLVGVASPRPVWFMAKSELFQIPVLGPMIRRVHAFPVKRGVADRQALRQAHQLLTAGHAVTIFFEGGRSRDGKLMPPELGVSMIALRAGVPIVPIAIIDADHFMPREGGVKFARVKIIVGEPISVDHLAGKHADRAALAEISHILATRVADMMRAHGGADRVPADYPPQV
ncbi:MAG TPA: lysophospholipid acyltransferase family protein [Armatimonadota bacterium]|jgi:1-acyl-sn-glycerol-3-phosphate acyltransferase